MRTMRFHHFQLFTKSCGSYIPSFVRECYTSYKFLIPSGMKHVATVKPIDTVFVQGMPVRYDLDNTNVNLGRPKHMEEACKHVSKAISLDIMKDWLAPLISYDTLN